MNERGEAGPVLILLTGGRGHWPSVWAIGAYQPRRVYLVRPAPDTGDDALTQFLQSRHIPCGAPLPALAPYDLPGAQQQCEAIFSRHPHEPIVISLTPAPKMLAFGAERAVRKSGRADVGAFLRDTVGRMTYPVAGHIPPPRHYVPTIDDYLAAYGRQPIARFDPARLPCPPETLSQIAAQLAQPETRFYSLMQQLRSSDNQGRRNRGECVELARPWQPAWAPMLRALAAQGLIGSLTIESSAARFRFVSPAAWHFLDGSWLELYAHDQARSLTDPESGESVFCDCRMSLGMAVRETTAEIDLAALSSSGLFLLAECKTTRETKVDYIKDIVDYAGLIGGAYCGKMFISSAPATSIPVNFRNQAAERRVHIVSGDELPQLRTRLADVLAAVQDTAR